MNTATITPTQEHTSVFSHQTVWTNRYRARLHVASLTGGIPSDPKIAKAWLAAKMGLRDAELEAKLNATIAERAVADPDASEAAVVDAALAETAININGFKRTRDGQLYIEGRQVKAMIRENISIALGAGNIPARLGEFRKGPRSFIAEHVMVVEDVIPLFRDGEPVLDADEIEQSFVHTARFGSAISYCEIVHDVDVEFTVIADNMKHVDPLWATLWTTAEQNGLGARRSQGSGRFVVTAWENLSSSPASRKPS